MHAKQTCKICEKEFIVETGKRGRKRVYCSHGCAYDKYEVKKRRANYYKKFPEKQFHLTTKSSAEKRGLTFDLSVDWFKKRLDAGVCEATGLPIKTKPYKENDIGNRGFYSPSIDRIDNNVGYIESNCRVVCWGYNLSKNKYTDRDIIALSVSILLRYMSPNMKCELINSLPENILAALPSGFLVEETMQRKICADRPSWR